MSPGRRFQPPISHFSVEAEMNIREVNVNSQRTQVLKEGRVVDQNSTTTKEVRIPSKTKNSWQISLSTIRMMIL